MFLHEVLYDMRHGGGPIPLPELHSLTDVILQHTHLHSMVVQPFQGNVGQRVRAFHSIVEQPQHLSIQSAPQRTPCLSVWVRRVRLIVLQPPGSFLWIQQDHQHLREQHLQHRSVERSTNGTWPLRIMQPQPASLRKGGMASGAVHHCERCWASQVPKPDRYVNHIRD